MKPLPAAGLFTWIICFPTGPAALAAELLQGRCHMNYCNWFSIESRDIVASGKSGALAKAEIKEWGSYHPDGDYKRHRPRTGGQLSASYFFCSKTKPAAIWEDAGKWQGAVLNVASPSGAEENITIQYFAVCHGVTSGNDADDAYDVLARRFGYSPIEGADLPVLVRPEDILRD
jgi:hypothetical protein